MHLKVIFFGSFQSYSVLVLEKLAKHFEVIAVITTPPQPAGRHLKPQPTEVQLYAEKHHLPVYPLDNLETIPNKLPFVRKADAARRAFSSSVTALAPGLDGEGEVWTLTERAKGEPRKAAVTTPHRPDFLVVAGYGKLIPPIWLAFPKVMPINMHPSLLPHYRGAFPAEWAIIRGEKQTGVTLVKMSPEFDKGEILAQQSLTIAPTDTRETLYAKLYDLGANLLVKTLPKIAAGQVSPRPQLPGNYFYARRITREDGQVPWKELSQALTTNPQILDLKLRALSGWPGVWTVTPWGKRLKLLQLKPQTVVQLEGKQPVSWSQFAASYQQINN